MHRPRTQSHMSRFTRWWSVIYYLVLKHRHHISLKKKCKEKEGLPHSQSAFPAPMKQEMSCAVCERKGGIKPLDLFFCPGCICLTSSVSIYVKLILLECTVSLLGKVSTLQNWEWSTHSWAVTLILTFRVHLCPSFWSLTLAACLCYYHLCMLSCTYQVSHTETRGKP